MGVGNTLDSGGGGRKVYSCIAATTGHTDTLSTGPVNLHGVVLGTVAANGTIAIYDSTGTDTLVGTITMSSGNVPAPLHVDFHGVALKRRLAVVTTGAMVVTFIYS